MGARKLTVSGVTLFSRSGLLANRSKKKHVPYIRLQGNWLINAGFEPGDRVSVEPKGGKLIIRKEAAI